MKITLKQLTPLLIVFTILVASDFINAAWDPPDEAPSQDNNAPAPINVSIDAQTKGGQLTVLRSEALTWMKSPQMMSNEYCNADGTICTQASALGSGGGDTSNFLNTGDTDQTKEGSLTVNGGIYAPFFCDQSGGNCSSAYEIFTTVNGGGGGSGDYLDTSSDAQVKAGDLTVGGLVVTDRELHFDNAGTGGDYIRWISGEGLYGYENGSFAWKLGRDGSIDAARYCDANGNNCTDASDLGGTSIDTSNFLDTSNSNQIKSGDLQVGGLTVVGDRAIYFNTNQTSGDYIRWITGDGFYGYENGNRQWKLGSDSSINVNSYCRRDGANCISHSDLKSAVEAVLNDGITIECVSGVHRESGSTGTQTSSLGNNYSFSSVFVASFRNSKTQPEIRCTNGWTMTGCSAGTANGTSDNDESMDGRNMCVGDQAGDSNVIHARCCRVVLK